MCYRKSYKCVKKLCPCLKLTCGLNPCCEETFVYFWKHFSVLYSTGKLASIFGLLQLLSLRVASLLIWTTVDRSRPVEGTCSEQLGWSSFWQRRGKPLCEILILTNDFIKLKWIHGSHRPWKVLEKLPYPWKVLN